MNIKLHIDRLILDGVNISPGQHHVLKSVISNELANQLAAGGLSSKLAQGASLQKISTAAIQFNGDHPRQMGRQIARSVYGGIYRV